MKVLTQKLLKELVDYNPDTGIFTWNVRTANCIKVGDIAGCVDKTDGYVRIQIKGVSYRAHRLAFLYMEGYFPEHECDHMKGIRGDNKWEFIRQVTHSCNMQNQKINSRNKSGFPGVFWHKSENKWAAQIIVNKKKFFLGYYLDKFEAALSRLTFEVQHQEWTCNHRSELVKRIKKYWPEFNERCLS